MFRGKNVSRCIAWASNGFETYHPCVRERRLVRGRKTDVRPPLFPGYAFVRIELQWHQVRWGVGIIGLIMGDNGPARLADSIVNGIKMRERNGAVDLPSAEPFQQGDRVRVTEGAFAGHLAIFDGMSGADRCRVLLAALGGLTLPVATIEAAARQD